MGVLPQAASPRTAGPGKPGLGGPREGSVCHWWGAAVVIWESLLMAVTGGIGACTTICAGFSLAPTVLSGLRDHQRHSRSPLPWRTQAAGDGGDYKAPFLRGAGKHPRAARAQVHAGQGAPAIRPAGWAWGRFGLGGLGWRIVPRPQAQPHFLPGWPCAMEVTARLSCLSHAGSLSNVLW